MHTQTKCKILTAEWRHAKISNMNCALCFSLAQWSMAEMLQVTIRFFPVEK